MTDRKLRNLNRLAAQGDLDAQARHLFGRVRAGDLSRERLELAAWLGDLAARRVPGTSDTARDHWLRAGHYGNCATLSTPQPADLHARALARVEDRMASRDWAVREWAKHMRQRVLDEDGLALRWPGIPPASTCPLCLRSFTFSVWLNGLTAWKVDGVLPRACQAALAALGACDPSLLPRNPEAVRPRDRRRWIRTAGFHLSEQTVREAIRDALVPWLLEADQRPAPPRGRRRGRALRSLRLRPRSRSWDGAFAFRSA